ncbi:acetyl-coenzyme A synthetase N-terminal domain-containing protein, partial [Arthrobacter sp. ZGTC131]|uniref:acetyl-coenzyme A synthetase N-terminal domain-containing protein n=1 Tax=Arthrobacter sp. ZGTC131 TaxID=2058898 RepID=UPI0028007184
MSEQSPVKQQGDALENLLHERRSFPPSADFAAGAVAQQSVYDEAAAEGPEFWARQARSLLTWDEDFTETPDWSGAPLPRRFGGRTLNAADRSLARL